MQGSLTLAACWRDESDNKVLKASAQTSHSAVFHSRVLATWRLHSSRASLKRKAQDVRSAKKKGLRHAGKLCCTVARPWARAGVQL